MAARLWTFCPVHEYERQKCWDGCLPERIEMERAFHALRSYWRARRRGVKPKRD